MNFSADFRLIVYEWLTLFTWNSLQKYLLQNKKDKWNHQNDLKTKLNDWIRR